MAAVPPQKLTLILAAKRALTNDVWELDFAAPEGFACRPGQFVMFTLTPAPNRAYSVAWAQPGLLRFIIKRVENGGGGSKAMCDLPVGGSLPALGPVGHFVLTEGDAPRMFIGTGTGFSPLYFQARALLARDPAAKASFVFGVRSAADLFYTDELAAWRAAHPGFSSTLFLSRDDVPGTCRGYVTDLLTPEGTAGFQEFFLCGSPAMVTDARAKLEALGIPKEKVFFEQY